MIDNFPPYPSNIATQLSFFTSFFTPSQYYLCDAPVRADLKPLINCGRHSFEFE